LRTRHFGSAAKSKSDNGNTTINGSAGVLDANGNRVFNVTAYNAGNGNIVTINGDGHDVVLNFLFNSNVNLGGDVTLVGLGGDDVVWNFASSNQNISLNNNASSFPLPLAFQGIILAPNDALSIVNANLVGRVWGGDSHDMQVVSGDTLITPVTAVPEPSTWAMMLIGFVGLGFAFRHSRRKLSFA
jgi:PEP-CTERM motif